VERYETWRPISDLPEWFATASVNYNGDTLEVTLHCALPDRRHLSLTFGRAPAFRSIVEECRLGQYVRRPAVSNGAGPLWTVIESAWLARFSEADRIHYPRLVHYLLESGDQCIDVLAHDDPIASWAKSQAG
jgi:hypothetical protein